MQERTEWPTRSYLEDLRDQGQVAFSRLASAAFITTAVLLSTLLLVRLVSQFCTMYIERGVLSLSRAEWVLLVEIAAIPPLAVLVTGLLTGLLQTGFHLKIDLSMKAERLAGAHRLRITRLLWFVVMGLFSVVGAILVGVGSFILLARTALAWLVLGRDAAAGIGWFMLSRFVVVALPALFVCVVVGWLLSRLVFRYTHRMTRAEVEAEFRGSL